MIPYGSLSAVYNDLMRDIDYGAFADFYKKIFSLYGRRPGTILDIGCGTGTLSYILSDRGYDVTAADPSPEMLAVASQSRGCRRPDNPLFICQGFRTLDLYGTVEAAVCSLDCVNYITDIRSLKSSFKRLSQFIEPGGLFIFDVNTLEKFRKYRDGLFVDQTEDVYCVWRTEFSEDSRLFRYTVDLFQRRGTLWELNTEEHVQRAYGIEELEDCLKCAGFEQIRYFGTLVLRPPEDGDERIFISAVRADN